MSDSDKELFFTDYVLTGVNIGAYVLSNIVTWCVGAFVDIMNSKRMQDLGLNIIIIYGKAMSELENFGKYIYKNNDFVKDVVNTYNWMYDAFSSLILTKNREPENVNWIQTCCLNKDNANKYHYFETYRIIDDEMEEDVLESRYTNAWCKGDEMNDFNVIMKYKNDYSVNLRKVENVEKRDASSYSTLAISYKHKNDPVIALEIADSMWSVGNELFSPVFVRRCLEYQCNYFNFSYDYKIEIMDSNADIITLNSNQYILVEENSVSVKDIDSVEEEEELEESSEKPLPEEDSDSDSDYVPSDQEDE
tara:strand:- start:1832 stop:2749 length:918 start_codon:yes stop_codon:yes gene_type:complete